MIKITGLCRSYGGRAVLNNIDLNIEKGGFVAILGRNGSGKSTLIRHLNALLTPERGKVEIDGMDTADRTVSFDIRKRVGIVFQNPDSQAVASIVEDDTAFAPENLGLDEEETEKRITFALLAVGIDHLRRRNICELSGGQKQLTAIAGILAMRPEYMVFDECTSMLDPEARARILTCVHELNNKYGTTIIWITHHMDEAAGADRVIILDNGMITADGTPRTVFSQRELVNRSGMKLPGCAALALRLRDAGYDLGSVPLTAQEFAGSAAEYMGGAK